MQTLVTDSTSPSGPRRRGAGALAAVLTAVLAALLTTASARPAVAAQDGAAAADPGGDAPYRSPMRAQCEEELIKDAKWKAELKQQLAPEIHQEDANQMLTNRRHVVMAYALLWILMLGFVVFMWMRQRGLSAQITRLEREIEQATRDD